MSDVPPVKFDVTGEARYARLVRTASAALAATESFSVDRTDDLRLLVDEVFNALLCAGAPRVVFEASPTGGELRIVMRGVVAADEAAAAFATVRRVAAVIAPGFGLVVAHGQAEFSATVTAHPA